ncbi:hypothetical protein [Falsirhodobacter deserti]|uniref:hypothetical protein n=1 Tax=Falsirhodobacter deserti TaxID=1365611 RepID=UPI0013E39EEF|nr:hypothetical protein [Falsirhodobacter deserti]
MPVASAVGYALQKDAPDAIKRLVVSAETLRVLTMAKLDTLNKGQAKRKLRLAEAGKITAGSPLSHSDVHRDIPFD